MICRLLPRLSFVSLMLAIAAPSLADTPDDPKKVMHWRTCEFPKSTITYTSENILRINVPVDYSAGFKIARGELKVTLVYYEDIMKSRSALRVQKFLPQSGLTEEYPIPRRVEWAPFSLLEASGDDFNRYLIKHDFPRVLVSYAKNPTLPARVQRQIPMNFEADFLVAKKDFPELSNIDHWIYTYILNNCGSVR